MRMAAPLFALAISVVSFIIIAKAIHKKSQPLFQDQELVNLAHLVRDSTGNRKLQNAELFCQTAEVYLKSGGKIASRNLIRIELGTPDWSDTADCDWEYHITTGSSGRHLATLCLKWESKWTERLIGINVWPNEYLPVGE